MVAGVEASSTDKYVKISTSPVDKLNAAWEDPLDGRRLKIDLARRISRQSDPEDSVIISMLTLSSQSDSR